MSDGSAPELHRRANSWAGPLAALDEAARHRLLWIIAAACLVAVTLGARAQYMKSHDGYVFAVLAHAAVYVAAAWAVVTVRFGKRALATILVVAALLRVVAFTVPVGLTTDGYRYVWDGRLQAAGVNPYLTVPADPRLKQLQDDRIFPNINGKDSYPTIYPPLAQISFLLGTRIHDSIEGYKFLAALLEAALIAALIAWLRALNLPRERVLIYAWHPLPLWEFTGSGHVDVVAALCVVLALLAAARNRPGLAGAAFAGAFLVKYWPAYLAAAVWRRWEWRFIAGGGAALVLLTTPYVWPDIIGFGFPGIELPKLAGSLFKHLNDEGYNDEGWGFFLAYAPNHFGWWVMSGPTYAKIAALALIALAAAIVFRRNPDPAEQPKWLIVLISAFLLAISPHYPWYYALAVPLLATYLYPPLLWVTLVVTAIYIEIDYVWLTPYPRFKVYLVLYGGFLVLALLTWRWRPQAPLAGKE